MILDHEYALSSVKQKKKHFELKIYYVEDDIHQYMNVCTGMFEVVW